MLGQPMTVTVHDKLSVKLGPFTKEDALELMHGMQLDSVTRYLNNRRAFTAEDQEEWYDRVRNREDSWTWGIWDITETPKLIGTTALNGLVTFPFRQVTSGVAIVDKSYWGKGIASATHKARTWYAFHELGIDRIKSAVLSPNIASKKALERSGYVELYTERNERFVDGQYIHEIRLACLNPRESTWSAWWGDDQPAPEFVAARQAALEALAWAEENVELL